MDHIYSPPYFSRLLEKLRDEDEAIGTAFGKHVHWGYFADSEQTAVSASDYGQAAEQMCLKLIDLAGIEDGQSILDVGCGFGGTISCLNEQFSRAEIVGVNIDAQQLQRAVASLSPRADNRIEFVLADAARLPLPDDSFDHVLCVESIFHFDRPKFFSEVARVLRPGGSLTLSDFVPDQQAVRFLQDSDLVNNPAVQSSYGAVDMSWSVSRYEETASQSGLSLNNTIDVSTHSLPTYDFLRTCVQRWEDKSEGKQFQRATNLLEQATRRGFIAYLLMRFD